MNNYTEVNVKVTGQALQLASVPLIASGGINSVKVIFTFDSLWDGMAKTAVFYTDPKRAVQVLLTDDWAVVPSEILGKDGTFSLGVFGTNEEQVLPSALVELSINKGAAALQPVDPAEPTPDIYSQIMSAYAVLKARMDALVTMKGIGAEYGTVSDEHVNGIFKSNGYSAFLNFTISGLSLAAGDRHYTDYFLSANRAPLSTVEMETSDPALKVTIEAPTAEGLSRVLIENISSTDYAADKFTIVTAFYPLANTGNTEVTDMRVGYDNTVYPTAAEAVRAQFSKIATDAAEQRMTHFMITYDEETDSWICSTPYIGLQNRLATHRLQSLVMVKGHTFCSVDRIESDPDDGVKALDLYTEWGVFRFSPDESIVKIAEPESGGGDGGSYFGIRYSDASKVIDLSESVKMYLFATPNGYDAVIAGTGAIHDFTEDNRPYDAQSIFRLHIEDGITSIGDYFMHKAYNLKVLTFADSTKITHLGAGAFGYTSISGEYDFTGLADTKLDSPFKACPKLQGVTFGGTITEIAEKSFQMCVAMRYVKGIAGVITIGNAAFQYCTSLESIDVNPSKTALGNWVFILTPIDAKIEGTDTDLSNAQWKSQGNLCFVPNEWTVDQLAAIRAVTGNSVQFPIPESDNQGTDFYRKWKIFPLAVGNKYAGIVHPASGCCGIFSLFHVYNILNPNAQYDTFYDFITRGIVPKKLRSRNPCIML